MNWHVTVPTPREATVCKGKTNSSMVSTLVTALAGARSDGKITTRSGWQVGQPETDAVCSLSAGVRLGFIEKAPWKVGLKGGKGLSHTNTQGKTVPLGRLPKKTG